jgi:hypothetical protein
VLCFTNGELRKRHGGRTEERCGAEIRVVVRLIAVLESFEQLVDRFEMPSRDEAV